MAEICDDLIDGDINLADVKFIKQLGGAEDLMWGLGSVTQIRNGQAVVVTKINAETVPFNQVDSVKTIIDKIIERYPI